MPEANPANEEPGPTLNHLFFHAVEAFSTARLLEWGLGEQRIALSTRSFESLVLQLAYGLRHFGIKAGDRVVLMSPNRPEWHVAEFACSVARAISVPVFPNLPANQISDLIRRSGATAALYAGAECRKTLAAILPPLSHARLTLDIADLPLE